MLYAGSIAWVIGYDTIYAHQDREDDALIGVKSTARLFGARTQRCGRGVLFARGRVDRRRAGADAAPCSAWIGLAAFAGHLVWQIRRLDIRDPALCLRIFKSNRDAGLLLFAGLLGGRRDARGCVAVWRGQRAHLALCLPPPITDDVSLLRFRFAPKLSRCNSRKSSKGASEMRRVGITRRECDIDNPGIRVAQKFGGIFIAGSIEQLRICNARA